MGDCRELSCPGCTKTPFSPGISDWAPGGVLDDNNSPTPPVQSDVSGRKNRRPIANDIQGTDGAGWFLCARSQHRFVPLPVLRIPGYELGTLQYGSDNSICSLLRTGKCRGLRTLGRSVFLAVAQAPSLSDGVNEYARDRIRFDVSCQGKISIRGLPRLQI